MPTALTSPVRRARYAALLIALPLLAGCSAGAVGAHAAGAANSSSAAASASSGSGSGSASTSGKGPCDYLSAADASAIVGATVTSSEAGGACSYTGGLVGFATTVTGNISGSGDPAWKNEVSTLGGTKLSGVGDEAYGGGSAVEEKIVVLSGHTIIEVADADDSTSTTFPNSIAVAKAIIAKLG